MRDRLLLEYEGTGHDTFEDFLIARNEWVDYCFEQSESWAGDLEKLLMNIQRSGLLKDTEFGDKLEELYRILDV